MAKNDVQRGKIITLTAPAGGVVSGNMYKVGQLLVVAQVTAAATEPFSCDTEGVHELPKATGALTEGALLYWDDTAKDLTATASGNQLAGVAVAAAGSGDAVCLCRLNGAAAVDSV